MKKQIFLMLSFFVAGCSTINYLEPVSGPVSKVRFVSDSSSPVIVWGYQDSLCNGEFEWMRLRNGYLVNSTPKVLDIPMNEGFHKNSFKEFLVSSEEEHVFMFKEEMITGNSHYSCGVPVKVKFSSNEMYELSFHAYINACSVDVNRIDVGSNGEYRRENIFTYTNKVQGFGDGCKDAFQKIRWY